MHDLVLVLVFGGIAVTHYLAEKHLHADHYHAHWLVWFAHPTVLTTLKDWLVHLMVYSKYALVG